MIDHNDPSHVYHPRRNPSGCDKFYCLRRFRKIYYWTHWRPRGGWAS